MGKRDGALVEAQRRMRSMAVRQDLVLGGWFRAADEVAALGQRRRRSGLDTSPSWRRWPPVGSLGRRAWRTAAVAVTIGGATRAAEVLGTSERKVTRARRSVSLSGVEEAIDRGLKKRSAQPPTGVEPFSAPKGASSLA